MHTKKRLLKYIICIELCVLSLSISGCQNPVTAMDQNLSRVEGVAFPLDCRAEIVIPLGSIDDTIVFSSGYDYIELDKSESMINAARFIFEKIFREVDIRGNVRDPHFVIKVKSRADIDPSSWKYNVNVDCAIEYGDGSKFGSFEGVGDERAAGPEQAGLDKAYIKAFIDIVDEMTSDAMTIQLLKKGVDKKNIRKTSEVENTVSMYQDFIDSVITIELYKNASEGLAPLSMHGSGFFIDDKATILTSSHVISQAEQADTVKLLYKRKEYDLDILIMDEWNDLALIRAKGLENKHYLELLDKGDTISVGDEVIIVGSPLTPELEQTVSKGIISSFRQVHGYRLIQTDTAVNPGNSGGPLVHVGKKKVIGVVSLMALGEGLCFAVPPETIYEFLEENNGKY